MSGNNARNRKKEMLKTKDIYGEIIPALQTNGENMKTSISQKIIMRAWWSNTYLAIYITQEFSVPRDK